jgi:SEC-C motif-containing protein
MVKKLDKTDKYSQCPCDSKQPYDKCCRPYHQGDLPQTALCLMRSRYSAYSLGLVDYVIASTHKDNAAYTEDLQAWRQDLESFCRQTSFTGLKILQVEEGVETSTVSFTAYLRQGDTDASFSEKSNFAKQDGRWLYRSGEIS